MSKVYCLKCEKELQVHSDFMGIIMGGSTRLHYCDNKKCSRLGLATVLMLIDKEEPVPAGDKRLFVKDELDEG